MRLLLTLFALIGCLSLLQAQVESRSHQIITDLKGVTQMEIAAKDDMPRVQINLRESYSTAIVIEVLATVDKIKPQEMETLIKQGRYRLGYEVKENRIIFHRPSDQPILKVDGLEVEEYIIYNISVPEYIKFR